MTAALLILNTGSSSLKFAAYDSGKDELPLIFSGQVQGIGSAPRFTAYDMTGNLLTEQPWTTVSLDEDHRRALSCFLEWLEREHREIELVAVGHHIVNGGTRFAQATLLDKATMEYLETLIPLTPLHQPKNLAAVKELARLRPQLIQIGCFGTAFHRGHPEVADHFALPVEFHARGIRRYGFHGLSYEYIARRLAELDPVTASGRVVTAHLGSGASMCALRNGRSIDSTLTFSSLDGLPMGTRCGSIDPGVVLHLLREYGLTVGEVEDILTCQSGLLGLSGISNDMRVLLESNEKSARMAVDYFVYHVGGQLGRLAAALGGLDALVFTAGIGERSPAIRARVCHQAGWLGIEIDADANARNDLRISLPGRSPSVWVIPTNEERMIAIHTRALMDSVGRQSNRAVAQCS